MSKFVVYATTNNGDGYTEIVGTYDSLEEIVIRIALFAKDVVLNIERVSEEQIK